MLVLLTSNETASDMRVSAGVSAAVAGTVSVTTGAAGPSESEDESELDPKLKECEKPLEVLARLTMDRIASIDCEPPLRMPLEALMSSG